MKENLRSGDKDVDRMEDFLKKLYKGYVDEVVSSICKRSFGDATEEDHAWNLGTFDFFYRKGEEYFSGLNLEEDDFEIRYSSGFLGETNPILYERYLERFKADTKRWLPGEYLVDLCWRRWDGNRYRTELAMELEWEPTPLDKDWGEPVGEEDFDEDIYKLLDVRAPSKVGILGCGSDPDWYLKSTDQGELVKRFADYVRSGDYGGEAFLLVFVDNFEDGAINGYVMDDDGEYKPLKSMRYTEFE